MVRCLKAPQENIWLIGIVRDNVTNIRARPKIVETAGIALKKKKSVLWNGNSGGFDPKGSKESKQPATQRNTTPTM